MRLCPTLPGDDRALIAHSICVEDCMQRQRDFYHKCHRCVFRGKPAQFEVAPAARNGVAEGPGEVSPRAADPAVAEPAARESRL